jgi:Fe-S-cluster containining protein
VTTPESPFAHLPEEQQAYLNDAHFRAREAIAAALAAHGRAPGLALAVARARLAFLGAELEPVEAAMAKAGTPVDCRAGCFSCCTLMVEPTPDEIFALAAHLEATLDPAALAVLEARAAENTRRGAGLPAEERHRLRLFCPVLDPASGACRGHPVRPTACQGYLSLDRRRCEADSAGTPTPIRQPAAAGLLRDAVLAARTIELEDAGLDQTRIELSAGLVAAWEDSDAERRWLAGGPAFPPVRAPKP